ncbi:SGT1 protein-domain-containing protein [Choanephora cucurbitarum]|nr:SGT1 protein-domain-containing protein [Choanephora cucurbitarum]
MSELNLEDIFKGSSSKEINYIQYAIYLPPKDSDQATRSYLRDTMDMIHSLTQPIIDDYIWQKDRFQLSIAYAQDQDPTYPFLFGASRFGDCINDEWFIVYLLQQISKDIPEAVIALNDNDGDVILIEAALDLPHWLDPSNSQNRVYLYRGQVHIIPLPTSPADIMQLNTGRLRRERAIDQVRTQPSTLASHGIQQAIADRTDPYPLAARQEHHRSRILLPSKAAFALLSQPQLITYAIEAFYLRDPIAMKACAAMATFSPSEGMVETTIRFTKTSYAQAVSQKFYAPKPFRLPSMKEKKKYHAAELGMKVACGLEMLYHNSLASHDHHEESMATYDFEADKKFAAYLAHLDQLGYFRDQKKGSQLYRQLYTQAKEQYLMYKKEEALSEKPYCVALEDLDVDDEETFKQSLSLPSLPRQTIDTLLSHYSDEALEKLLDRYSNEPEDSDDWMNVDPQQLEELLMKRMGTMNQSMMADLQKDFSPTGSRQLEEGVDLEKMMSNFENFVENSKSGIDGVEFPNDLHEFSDDEDEDEDEEEGAIQFDMAEFMRILKGAENVESEKDLTEVMDEMDQEIFGHEKISNSFTKLSKEEDEEDEDAPVDVQLNLVKNVLESFKSQQGLPGPVGNMLSQFGFVLPGDNEEEK